MASRRSRPRRLLLPTVLAAVLAAELTGLALARTLASATPAAPATTIAAPVAGAASTAPAGRIALASQAEARDAARDALSTVAMSPRSRAGELAASPGFGPANAIHVLADSTRPKTASPARSGPASTRGSHPASASYTGRNHVWIPSLGINKGVQSFPCSRTRPPDAGVYRWGCGGRNNIYLLGHAWSTFKPLHDAYVGGRLHTGMKVIYADGGGTVHTYSVVWWKVVPPTTAASWAWAAQSRPSMTLQTCVGANSAYRLMVRLVQIG
jgi:Sortase domain